MVASRSRRWPSPATPGPAASLLSFDLVVNHVPVLDSEGNPSTAPGDLVAAFTRFQYHEAITSLLYTSQLGPG